MAEDHEIDSTRLTEFDPRFQTENLAFDPKTLVVCNACRRTNPPNRLKCFYCGLELDVSLDNPSQIKVTLRTLEDWELGFNVILRKQITAKIDSAKAGNLVGLDREIIDSMLISKAHLPLARVESEKEAAVIAYNLETIGLHCTIVSDASLSAMRLPTRLAGISFHDDEISVTDFNKREATRIDLTLIVSGTINESRTNTLEKRRRRGNTTLLDESSVTNDEAILDIYGRDDPYGFRIHLTGFDFSCLGGDKALLAVENIRRLSSRLNEIAPDAKLIDNYKSIRQALSAVWEPESRTDPQGLKRSGFGKVDFGKVATTTNLRQFTKYSRLQWHLL